MIRNFTWEDLSNLCSLMNAVHAADGDPRVIDDMFLRAWLTQPGWAPLKDCWLVEEHGTVVGYSILHQELLIGRTVLELGVEPSYDSNHIQSIIIHQGLSRAAELGARVLHVCTSPGSSLINILDTQGFRYARSYWLMRWEGTRVAVPPPSNDFVITPFQDGDAEKLTLVQNESFDGSWGFCANTVEQIDYRTRLAENYPCGIFLLSENSNVAGYCWTYTTGDFAHSIGTIGMIGITPTYRGKGLSRQILLAGMNYLCTSGVQDIRLDVDGCNAAAIGLYESVGFKKVGELHWFESTLFSP